MNQYTNEELAEALKLITSTISNCEKMQPKFEEGTSQHTLLKNRIKALYISKALVMGEEIKDRYTEDEVSEALSPIASIISKSEKAILKAKKGTATYTRLSKIIKAMYISKALITDEIK